MNELIVVDKEYLVNVTDVGIFVWELEDTVNHDQALKMLGNHDGKPIVFTLQYQLPDSQIVILYDQNSLKRGDSLRLITNKGIKVFGDAIVATTNGEKGESAFCGLNSSQVWLTISQLSYCVWGVNELNVFYVLGKHCFPFLTIELPDEQDRVTTSKQ